MIYPIHTEVLQVDPTHPEEALVQQAAQRIRTGELVVFPTETVYGLGANIFQPAAVESIFTAKGRPFSDPLIVHIAEQRMLERLVNEISPHAQQLMNRFWPGPLTLILPAGPRVSRTITAGLPSVAIRMPRHPVALALIRAADTPLAAPSANRFTHVSPTTAQHVLADLGGRVPLILDSGPCEVGVESTVLNLSTPIPTLLRPGGISLEDLRNVLPDIQLSRATPTAAAEPEQPVALASPGQMMLHYAPRIPTFLFEGTALAMRNALLAEVERRQHQGERVGVLIGDEDVAAFTNSGASLYSLGSTPEQIATRLFAGLRELEEAEVQAILCRSFEEQGLGLAIRDRLRKAAGGKIILVQE